MPNVPSTILKDKADTAIQQCSVLKPFNVLQHLSQMLHSSWWHLGKCLCLKGAIRRGNSGWWQWPNWLAQSQTTQSQTIDELNCAVGNCWGNLKIGLVECYDTWEYRTNTLYNQKNKGQCWGQLTGELYSSSSDFSNISSSCSECGSRKKLTGSGEALVSSLGGYKYVVETLALYPACWFHLGGLHPGIIHKCSTLEGWARVCDYAFEVMEQ